VAASARAKDELLLDPVGFLKAHGVEGKDVALVGEALMYELMPDKAPPDLRARMVGAQMTRKQRSEAAERERTAAKAEADEEARQAGLYQGALKMTVQALGEDDFPASQAWFSGNHDEYSESLWHTANNMAAAADREGRRADLSPRAVAAELEKFLDERSTSVATRKSKRAAGAPEQKSADPKNGEPKIAPPRSVSAQSLGGSGAPRPKAISESERVQRAIEALAKRQER
jgi:hypothetical protein